MLYQNENNGLWYYEQTFTNPVNGFVEGCCYENGYNTGSCDIGGGWTGWCVDTYYISSNPTTLPESGTGWWIDKYYIGAVESTLPESGTGWDSLSSIYYIDGNATTLNESGNGYWGITYFFYIGGVQTTLPESGTGWWSNKYYIGGVESPLPESGNGWWNNIYYIGGVETTLPENGTGFWQNPQGSNWPDLYVNGNLFTGWFDNKYYIGGLETNLPQSGTGWWTNWQTLEAWFYINGVQTTLPESGTGLWEEKYYVNGNQFTGWLDSTYYVGGVQTTLPQNGTGWWTNKFYIEGVQTTLPQNGTGWWDNKYYISAIQTTLPQNGTGWWNNKYYINGVESNPPVPSSGYIYYGQSAPIKLADKQITFFPEGLIMVQQGYKIRVSDEATYQNYFAAGNILDVQSAAIDNLYIHPKPNFSIGADGFITINVTAYGRTNTEGITTNPAMMGDMDETYIAPDGRVFRGTLLCLWQYVVVKRVVLSGQFTPVTASDYSDIVKVRNPSDFSFNFPVEGVTDGGNQAFYAISVVPVVSRVDIQNFGHWDVITITITPKAQAFYDNSTPPTP